MERLQGSGATGASVCLEEHTTLGHAPRLGVECYNRWVLDALDMLPLDAPDVLYPLFVNQRNTKGVVATATCQFSQQLLKEADSGLLSTGLPPTMECQLLLGQPFAHLLIWHCWETLGDENLQFCLPKQSNISCIPRKDAS